MKYTIIRNGITIGIFSEKADRDKAIKKYGGVAGKQ